MTKVKSSSSRKRRVQTAEPKEATLSFLGGIEIRIDKNGKQVITDIPDFFKAKNPISGNVRKSA